MGCGLLDNNHNKEGRDRARRAHRTRGLEGMLLCKAYKLAFDGAIF